MSKHWIEKNYLYMILEIWNCFKIEEKKDKYWRKKKINKDGAEKMHWSIFCFLFWSLCRVFMCFNPLGCFFFFYTNRDVVLREYKCWGNETVVFLLTITLPPRVALFSGLSDYFCTTPSTHPLFVSIYAL